MDFVCIANANESQTYVVIVVAMLEHLSTNVNLQMMSVLSIASGIWQHSNSIQAEFIQKAILSNSPVARMKCSGM